MAKLFSNRYKTWMLMGLLLMGLWLIPDGPAQAGNVAKALAFDGTETSIEVLAIYETSYAAQKSTVKSLKMPSKLMKKAAGFLGSSMLQSQDGKQVIAFSQWQDAASYAAYAPPPGSVSPMPPEPSQVLAYAVAIAQPSTPGTTPALRGKEAVVQWVQFTPKDADGRLQVRAKLEEMVPALLEHQPIPQSVLLLQGLDTPTLALLVNWNCSALFEDVGEPQVMAIAPDLAALADSEQQLYNVVNIIPAEVEKPDEED